MSQPKNLTLWVLLHKLQWICNRLRSFCLPTLFLEVEKGVKCLSVRYSNPVSQLMLVFASDLTYNPWPRANIAEHPSCQLCGAASSARTGQRDSNGSILNVIAEIHQKLSDRGLEINIVWFRCCYWLATLMYFSILQFSFDESFQQYLYFPAESLLIFNKTYQ